MKFVYLEDNGLTSSNGKLFSNMVNPALRIEVTDKFNHRSISFIAAKQF